MKVFQCDLTQDELSTTIPANSIDIVLLMFVLSSITPDKMTTVLINISKVSHFPSTVHIDFVHFNLLHRY